MIARTNDEWLAALGGGDGAQEALADLRTYLLRAALFTLHRARHHIGRLGDSGLRQLAEDCAQEAIERILERKIVRRET
jgi:DNA-directed RNA polymerase specialized sigma24 family protein